MTARAKLQSTVFLFLFVAATAFAQESPGENAPGSGEQAAAMLPDGNETDRGADAAVLTAKKDVEHAILESGPVSNATAHALTRLAFEQFRSMNYQAARQNFETAIDIIGESNDKLHVGLVDPLSGLGNLYLRTDRPGLAAETFQRALHVTHVNYGPHNVEQLELLESLADTMMHLGDPRGAREVMKTINALVLRQYSDDKVELIGALQRRAEWLHRSGMYLDERTAYREIIGLIEAEKGKTDVSLVVPLTMLGRTFLYVDMTGAQPLAGTPATTGEPFLKRALRIAESNEETPWQLLGDARVALGDYYTITGNYYRARTYYDAAWEFLSADTGRHSHRDALLGQERALTKLDIPDILPTADADDGVERDLEGVVTATFSVSDRGGVRDMSILEVRPPEFTEMVSAVERGLRVRLYRPRYDDTGPREAPDRVLEHRFYFSQSELDAIRARQDADR